MAAIALKAPSANFGTLPLAIESVPAAMLYRISRHATDEPFFAKNAARRFDDAAKNYGTCYLGFSLKVAFAETVLHDAEPHGGCFTVAPTEITGRFAIHFNGADLRIAKLTGSALRVLGGHGELSGTADYTLPQSWSRAMHEHPAKVDGFIYMSRHINDSPALVLFDRVQCGKRALSMHQAVPLADHVDFIATVNELHIK